MSLSFQAKQSESYQPKNPSFSKLPNFNHKPTKFISTTTSQILIVTIHIPAKPKKPEKLTFLKKVAFFGPG